MHKWACMSRRSSVSEPRQTPIPIVEYASPAPSGQTTRTPIPIVEYTKSPPLISPTASASRLGADASDLLRAWEASPLNTVMIGSPITYATGITPVEEGRVGGIQTPRPSNIQLFDLASPLQQIVPDTALSHRTGDANELVVPAPELGELANINVTMNLVSLSEEANGTVSALENPVNEHESHCAGGATEANMDTYVEDSGFNHHLQTQALDSTEFVEYHKSADNASPLRKQCEKLTSGMLEMLPVLNDPMMFRDLSSAMDVEQVFNCGRCDGSVNSLF